MALSFCVLINVTHPPTRNISSSNKVVNRNLAQAGAAVGERGFMSCSNHQVSESGHSPAGLKPFMGLFVKSLKAQNYTTLRRNKLWGATHTEGCGGVSVQKSRVLLEELTSVPFTVAASLRQHHCPTGAGQSWGARIGGSGRLWCSQAAVDFRVWSGFALPSLTLLVTPSCGTAGANLPGVVFPTH